MTASHILLVDDDVELTELLADYLTTEGLEISVANSAEQALAQLAPPAGFDLAVFDIMMPGMSGLELLQQVRPSNPIPVIMLTGKGGDIDRILGLEMGADDYLSKPCNPRELLARIRAVLRRMQTPPSAPDTRVIQHWGLALQLAKRTLLFRDTPLELTSAEFNVITQFMQNPGVVLSKAKLTERVLHRELTAYDRAIDVHVSRVRQKLSKVLPEQELIKTVRGEGYLFIGEE